MRSWRLWAAALLTVLAAVRPAQAISGGHPADGKEFGFVRLLRIEWPDGKTGGCSGSQVGERLVLTAAHCVMGNDGRFAKSIEVRRKRSDRNGVAASAVHVHSGYVHSRTGPFFLRNDLAMLVLKEPIEGPYALTPFEFLWQKHKGLILQVYKPTFLRELSVADARKLVDGVLSRDPAGRPYAAQVGFGLIACDRETRKCARSTGSRPKYVLKFLFNYRNDRAIVPRWCDGRPYDLFENSQNLICTTDAAHTTLSPAEAGPRGVYAAQPGDSGGPAVVFDAQMRPFIIGVMSYGGMSTISINMNLVEHFDFLRDIELGSGPSFRTVTLGSAPLPQRPPSVDRGPAGSGEPSR